MNVENLQQKLEFQEFNIRVLRKFWCSVLEAPVPNDRQFALWLSLHPFPICSYGILQAGEKAAKERTTFSQERAILYASSVMNARSYSRRTEKINQAKKEKENGNYDQPSQMLQPSHG